MKTLTFEELSQKLNGKYWEKGDLKRIYLDKGYNTKKMSTKTFIYQNRSGQFLVNCKIDCPSQPYEWIISQESKIKKSVTEDISRILRLVNIEMVKWKELTEGNSAGDFMVYVSENEKEPSWYTEELFYEEFGIYPEDHFGKNKENEIEMSYISAREKIIELSKKESIITQSKVNTKEKEENKEVRETPSFKINFGVNTKVSHTRFGIGIVRSESTEKVDIDFEEGQKSLLKRFAPLKLVDNDQIG